MEISDVINIIGTTVLVFTLLELIKQRRLSYKPKPLPVISLFYLQTFKDIPAIWKSNYEDFFEKKKMPEENEHHISFYNGGLGPAIDLKFKWIINEKKIENQLIEYSKNYSDVIVYNKENKRIILKSKNKIVEYDLFKDKVDFRITNIPTNIDEKLKIYLPSTYIIYLSLIAFLEIKKKEKNEVDDVIGIKCDIQYKDTGNKIYTDRFLIKAKIHDYSGWVFNEKGKDMNFAVGEFNFTRRII